MRHGHHILSGPEPFMIGAAVLVSLCLLGIAIYLLCRWILVLTHSTSTEEQGISDRQKAILSGLGQKSLPMSESEIADALQADISDVAGDVRRMADAGLVHRQWAPDRNDYLVWARAGVDGKS